MAEDGNTREAEEVMKFFEKQEEFRLNQLINCKNCDQKSQKSFISGKWRRK